MGSQQTLGYGQADAPDEVQFGRARRHLGVRRPWLAGLLVAAVAAAAIGLATSHHATPPHHKPRSTTLASASLGRPILGIRGGWELFALGPDGLVTVAMASGKVTRTDVPPLQSGNPAVSLVIGPHEAVIRSFDFVPGYEVTDGKAARPLTGTMTSDGPLVPGPAPGEAWEFASPGQTNVLVLVTLSGHRLGPTIKLPPGAAPPSVTSDGRGNVLVLAAATGQQYDAGPGGYRRVHGQVIAVGPNHWVVMSCSAGRDCGDSVVDLAAGTQHEVPGAALRSVADWPPLGVVSPNGTVAAVVDSAATRPAVHLINLLSGIDTRVAVPRTRETTQESMVWSPDGRWLFVAADGKVLAVDTLTGRVTGLGISLPAITQLAVRPASG